MAFEGDTVTFTITNRTIYPRTMYWGVKETKGTITESDFDGSKYRIPSIYYLHPRSPQLTLNAGESQTISLQINNDRVIEGPEEFEVFSAFSPSGDKTTEAKITIRDSDKRSIKISSKAPYPSFERDSSCQGIGCDLTAAPGENKSLTKENFKFAEYEKKDPENNELETVNPISGIIALSPSSAVLRYTKGNWSNKNNYLALARKNGQGKFEEAISYKALPKFSTHRYFATINAAFDRKGNLYSIHIYYPSNSNAEKKTLLLKHNQKGKEVFQVPLPSKDFNQGIAIDEKNNLLISSSDHSDVTVERRSGKTGKQLWASQPFFEVDGGFNKSSRSLQALDDGSFLVAASGYLDIYGPGIGSYIAKVSLKDGSLQALVGVDGDFSYEFNEFLTRKNKIFFRTPIDAYSVRVDAKPIQPFNLPGNDKGKTSPKEKSGHQLTKPKQFRKRFVDKITNFNPDKKTLIVSRADFDIGKQIKFASCKNKRSAKALAKKDIDFIYEQKQGGLYYNENGSSRGFGDGGLVAILVGVPDIGDQHIQVV